MRNLGPAARRPAAVNCETAQSACPGAEHMQKNHAANYDAVVVWTTGFAGDFSWIESKDIAWRASALGKRTEHRRRKASTSSAPRGSGPAEQESSMELTQTPQPSPTQSSANRLMLARSPCPAEIPPVPTHFERARRKGTRPTANAHPTRGAALVCPAEPHLRPGAPHTPGTKA